MHPKKQAWMVFLLSVLLGMAIAEIYLSDFDFEDLERFGKYLRIYVREMGDGLG